MLEGENGRAWLLIGSPRHGSAASEEFLLPLDRHEGLPVFDVSWWRMFAEFHCAQWRVSTAQGLQGIIGAYLGNLRQAPATEFRMRDQPLRHE
jgi:hypothetical protein